MSRKATLNFQVLQIIAFASLFSVEFKFSKAFSVTHQDSYLANHVKKAFPGKMTWLDCTMACDRDHECISYNFHRSEHICELNNHGIQELCKPAESELLFREGWIYHQLRVSKLIRRCFGSRWPLLFGRLLRPKSRARHVC